MTLFFLNRFSHSPVNVTLVKSANIFRDHIKVVPYSPTAHKQPLFDLVAEQRTGFLHYPKKYDNGEYARELLFELEENYEPSKLRSVLFQIFDKYQYLNVSTAVIPLEEILKKNPNETEENLIYQITKIANLTMYRFDKYKQQRNPIMPKNIELILSQESLDTKREKYENTINETMLVANATSFARDLGNERADVVNPVFIEETAKAIFQKYQSNRDLTYESISGVNNLTDNRLNMIAAVGQGAKYDPRLIIINYRGDPESNESIALVGKGLTFDSGGLNLKPTGSIENMHLDMCGSAAVLGSLCIALEQKLKCNLTAVVGVAENAIDANSYKPYSILESHNGLTVEVGNTDAEGRLVLADALSYVQSNYNPTTVIDIATLTGACVIALGEYSAGVFANNFQLSSQIQQLGNTYFERCWPLPILAEHTEEISKCEFADLRSTGKGRFGGSCTAAAFLQKFIKPGTNWAHIDIAGPAMTSEKRGYIPKGGTGFGVELLFRYLQSSLKKN